MTTTIHDVYGASFLTDTTDTSAETDHILVGMTGNDVLEVSTGIDEIYGEYLPIDSRYWFSNGDDTARILWGDTTQSVTLTTTTGTGMSNFGYAREGDGSLRQVTMNRIDHVDITTGSGDDTFIGTKNKWDKLDGGAGTDAWADDFSDLSTPMYIDMALVSSETGQTFGDGTVVKNIEAGGFSSSSGSSTLRLTQGNDIFRDDGDYDDRVDGHYGDDLYVLSGGNDWISDDYGDNTLRILWGDETLGVRVAYSTAVVGYGKGIKSTHQVDFSGIDHLDVRAGSGDDILEGRSNSWDKFDGGAGVDLWKDNFSDWNKGLTIEVEKLTKGTGQTFADGTRIRDVERVNLTLTNADDYQCDNEKFSYVFVPKA